MAVGTTTTPLIPTSPLFNYVGCFNVNYTESSFVEIPSTGNIADQCRRHCKNMYYGLSNFRGVAYGVQTKAPFVRCACWDCGGTGYPCTSSAFKNDTLIPDLSCRSCPTSSN